MRLSESILYRLAKSWPSPVKGRQKRLQGDPSSDEYLINYALLYQFDEKVRKGIGFDIRGKRILEIGCGHGGITCFMAINGASRAVGIDINTRNLEIAERVQKLLCKDEALRQRVDFYVMNATELRFESESFEIITADNVFEHFMEPEAVLRECHRVLAKRGRIYIGSMPSFYSKHGLHLKNGLKVPWANLFFSEKTICEVMVRLCNESPALLSIYPGAKGDPEKVRDLRAYRDLNGMTYHRLRKLARENGFTVKDFNVAPTPRLVGSLVQRLPLIKSTVLSDIFSNKASCILEKN
jgi:ubiquinone/menaquinone biosynthesis C-methylase UbiE